MKPIPRTHTTDQQRHARAGRMLPPPPPVVVGDKARLNRGPRARPVPVPAPLAVSETTWVIRGKDGTYLGFAFGDGRRSHETNLYDHLPADRVPHLSNYVLSLTGIIPDAIGIDIGVSAGCSVVSGLAGLNILWHTRGEGSRAWYPEVHEYHGYSLAKANNVSLYNSVMNFSPNAAAAVQVILAWARTYDVNGVGRPASNAWVANGFNWTGGFWSSGFSIPYPPRFTIVGSYYQSVPFFSKIIDASVWRGVSFGIGVSGKFQVKSPFFKLDVTKLMNLKGLSVNQSKTQYGLVYGNGGDFIPQRGNRDITGWHRPVNQEDY